jgi:hypothetical protein
MFKPSDMKKGDIWIFQPQFNDKNCQFYLILSDLKPNYARNGMLFDALHLYGTREGSGTVDCRAWWDNDDGYWKKVA